MQTFNQLQIYQREALEIAERKYVEIAQRYELASQATRVWVWECQPKIGYFEVDPNLITWLGFEQPLEPADGDFFIHLGDRPMFWQAIEQSLEDPTMELSTELRLEAAQWGNLLLFVAGANPSGTRGGICENYRYNRRYYGD
ncbi:hypothetical protein NON20_06340 [Synechocystis sp. B12]|nr:hypothetical protein NON20_06340 [Synechocystis sp. B12]